MVSEFVGGSCGASIPGHRACSGSDRRCAMNKIPPATRSSEAAPIGGTRTHVSQATDPPGIGTSCAMWPRMRRLALGSPDICRWIADLFQVQMRATLAFHAAMFSGALAAAVNPSSPVLIAEPGGTVSYDISADCRWLV